MPLIKLQFPKRLREERKLRGWSQIDCGLKRWPELSPASAGARISAYETGRNEPSQKELEGFANLFDISTLELLVDRVDLITTVPLLGWSALMKKQPLSQFDLKIADDRCVPYLKNQILRIDPTLKPKNGDHVLVRLERLVPTICEYCHTKQGNYFRRLDEQLPQLHKENGTTYVFGVVISHTVFLR